MGRGAGEEVWVEVQDTGPGIPKEEIPRLFQRYARAKHPGVRGVAGTGLGLFISKHIVEAHGGRIEVESEEERGASSGLSCPCMARILVIEDEPLVGHMLRRFLERAGHEVVWAPNGEVGLRRLAEGFDLVVCDLIMPGIPGEEVIRRIREEAGPPVLAVSASVSRESQRRALEAGAQAFLGKPFEAQAFLRVVEGLLRGT